MTDRDGRLARQVAEAADAWLRDPLDAGVYRRLVDATVAWRARTDSGTPGPPALPETPARRIVAPDGEILPGPGTDTDRDADDARYLRPERAPRPVGSALGDVASMLRARAAAARAHEPDVVPGPDPAAYDGPETAQDG